MPATRLGRVVRFERPTTLAAHCALFVKERLPDNLVALTTGRSLRSAPMPLSSTPRSFR